MKQIEPEMRRPNSQIPVQLWSFRDLERSVVFSFLDVRHPACAALTLQCTSHAARSPLRSTPDSVVVEKLPQTAHGSSSSALSAITAESLFETWTSGLVGVGGGGGLDGSETCQSAGLAFQAGVLVAVESWAGRCGEGDDEVDAFCC